MDKLLLKLWRFVPSGETRKEDLADILELSSKQTARYLKKWAEEGWFRYTAGSGRGKVSTLFWLRDAEEVFMEHAVKIMEQEPVEISSKYLLFDWSDGAKQLLLERFRSKFGFSQNSGEIAKLIIPRRYKLATMHPLEMADVHSAHFVSTVFNRLVRVDDTGNVSPELAHSWDLSWTHLRLYLKKGVKFHDGSILTAEDVAECLNRMRTYPNFKELWEPVISISVPAPLVVDLHFPGGCSYCLHMLGMMNSSIFKESKGILLGSGSFYVDDSHELKTVLRAFEDYYGERPLLDEIEFVQVPKDIDITYRSSETSETEETFLVESDSGVGIVFMSSFRDSPIRRKEVRDFIHYTIAKQRPAITEVDPRILPNGEGLLVGYGQNFVPPRVPLPQLERPILLKTTGYLEDTAIWLKDVLEQEGIPVELVVMPFEKYMYDNGPDQQADLYIHGEVFEMNQDFSFFYFLINGLSPLRPIIPDNPQLEQLAMRYRTTPFENWHSLNREFEGTLVENSIMVPLYYGKRQIPFSAELTNVNISHFGYVDFSKLWVRPKIDDNHIM
ncbi:MarR-like DNA-binding transcriptional regulator SgrR of sgrS sRNA [Planomicrobium koreense]|uniref:MarR-like DNA-binding transcriptional regulator SgrR of sgrS sRNA n=1 Tax=Planococcus koreensis TaxID=112331 RepID=A0A7W8CS25_9BACL|nr:ABC transporter substrate-binding protein [Planococcus koreensis]MBB5180612.1 MarR-like DNA-binding transcriptional regulator SgrR of sgrS sRNA [Planococcus koreensis]